MIDLFSPPKPPAVRESDVRLVDQMTKGDGPRYDPSVRAHMRRTAEQQRQRLIARRVAEKQRRQLKRRQSDAARKMRAVAERVG